MINPVIYLLLLSYVFSAHCRIAINESLLDISNDLILDDKPHEKIYIDLPTTSEAPNTPNPNETISITTVTPTSVNKIDNNSTNDDAKAITTTTKPTTCTNNTGANISDNTIDPKLDPDGSPCTPEVIDVGTALILTPYIKEGRLEAARQDSRVDPDLFLGFESYSGFFTVNETHDSNIFFWYFPVPNKPVNETPWIIWLQGGPGASSMTGLFDEIGPFHALFNGTLIANHYSWLQDHSMIFIDNPVGSGFSFTNSPDGFTTSMDMYGDHLYSTVWQLVQVFPELRNAPLFVAGESYGGKYVPALAHRVHSRRGLPGGDINLQGMIIGNAYVDPGMISNLANPFYYFGLLEAEQMKIVKPLLTSFQEDIAANRSVEAKTKWNQLISILLLLTNQKHAYNFLRDDLGIGKYSPFLKRPDVKKALHVGSLTFSFINMTVNSRLNGDFLASAKPLYEELLDEYRVLTYCGQLDQMLSCVLTSENYRTWKWNASSEFMQATRFPYIFSDRLSGYHKTGGHLTEVVIRGAGHMAPLDAPAPTQHLVARWVRSQPLSQRFGYLEGSYVQEFIRNNSAVHYL